jgi:hypothetical protein
LYYDSVELLQYFATVATAVLFIFAVINMQLYECQLVAKLFYYCTAVLSMPARQRGAFHKSINYASRKIPFCGLGITFCNV